ncbi:hypothetical protein GCM10008915_36810 [Bifidobacterium pullorum subsp. gallinarum]
MNDNQRTVTLPTIPKEVAETVEYLREDEGFGGYTNEMIIEAARKTGGGVSHATKKLRSIPFDTLLSALVNGYVVEKSAEELAYESIRAEYRYYCGDSYGRGARHGIIYTLHTLGIKIEGVNA